MSGVPPDEQAKLLYGHHARHAPAWLYVQNQGNSGVIFVGASQDRSLAYGTDKTHVFVLGEIIVRPHFAIASNSCRGHGISGLVTNCHEDFIHSDDRAIICDPMGQYAKLERDRE
jgi:hypothetical protein